MRHRKKIHGKLFQVYEFNNEIQFTSYSISKLNFFLFMKYLFLEKLKEVYEEIIHNERYSNNNLIWSIIGLLFFIIPILPITLVILKCYILNKRYSLQERLYNLNNWYDAEIIIKNFKVRRIIK